ncbi:MAG: hypothetical protein R3B47_05255 [Bacteroidia bacterium]
MVGSYALLGRIHHGDTTGSILPESYWWPTGLPPEGERPLSTSIPTRRMAAFLSNSLTISSLRAFVW